MTETPKVQHINPETLQRSPFYTQAVKIPPGMATVFVGGQNAVDVDGQVVGDDAKTQSLQAMRNVEAAVVAAGGTLADVVRLGIAATDPAHLGPGFEAFQEVWGDAGEPPVVTVHVVAGLGPRFLVEVEAVAAVPA